MIQRRTLLLDTGMGAQGRDNIWEQYLGSVLCSKRAVKVCLHTFLRASSCSGLKSPTWPLIWYVSEGWRGRKGGRRRGGTGRKDNTSLASQT